MEVMKRGFLTWILTLAFLGTLAGCNLFSPQSSKVTVEVSFNMPGSSCSLQANLDGQPNVTVGPGTVYTFPSVDPGTHTVNLTSGGGCNSNACGFSSGSGSNSDGTFANTSDTFQGTAGKLAVVVVSQGAACQNMVVSGP
jgi:hypothetical protein